MRVCLILHFSHLFFNINPTLLLNFNNLWPKISTLKKSCVNKEENPSQGRWRMKTLRTATVVATGSREMFCAICKRRKTHHWVRFSENKGMMIFTVQECDLCKEQTTEPFGDNWCESYSSCADTTVRSANGASCTRSATSEGATTLGSPPLPVFRGATKTGWL